MSNTSLSKMCKADLESFFFQCRSLSAFMKSWIFSFNVGASHYCMENRFLLGDPSPNIQRLCSFGSERDTDSLPLTWCKSSGYLFLSVLHSKGNPSYQTVTIWATSGPGERGASDALWQRLPVTLFWAPPSLPSFQGRNEVNLFCAVKDDVILNFVGHVPSENESWGH